MACIAADGSLTEAALTLLAALSEPLVPKEIAPRVGQPLYRVRSSLREMTGVGLVEETDGAYQTTAAGRERVQSRA